MTCQAARAVALLDWLTAQPNGACKLEIPEGQFSDASTVLRRFTERGQIGYVMEPGINGQRRRYYVRDKCPEGAILAPLNIPRRAALAADPKHKPQPRHVKREPSPRLDPRAEFLAAEPIITERTKVTGWQPPPDPRRVVNPEPFFSAGKWLRPTWSRYA